MALKTRKPTNVPSWPLILLAGEAKTGKTYRAAEFTGDERVGRSFFLDLGEGSADEYGAVPGADYEILDHDGTWVDIIGQVEAVRDLAREALAKGEKPVSLTIDSMTAEWAMLCAWTDTRARRSANNVKQLTENPDAEIDITSNYWNDANSRHNRLMNILKTFPGIVIMTALETEKTQFGANGKPVRNAPKVARPDAQKRLTADATVWVRLSLENEPTIVGIRSLKHNITPGKDAPTPWADFTLSKLVFEFMGLGDGAQVRDVPVLNADQNMPGEEPEAPRPSDALTVAKKEVMAAGAALGWDLTKTLATYTDEHNGADLRAITDVAKLVAYRDDLKARATQPAATGPKAVADVPATEAGTPATDKLLGQIRTLAKGLQIPQEDVERNFKAKHGKAIGVGTEAELMTFRAELQKNGLKAPVRAAA